MYTDHFLEVAPVDGPIGYKLEAPPLHPVIASTTLPGFGELPIDRAGQFVAKVMPIPQAECDARAPNRPKGCEGNL